MRKLLLPIISLAIACNAASPTVRLMPESPEQYKPYDSELFIKYANYSIVDPMIFTPNLPNITELTRVTGFNYMNDESLVHCYVDTILPSYVAFSLADMDGNTPESNYVDNESKSELTFALPRVGKSTIGFIVYTTHPDGLDESVIQCYEIGDINKIRNAHTQFTNSVHALNQPDSESTDSIILNSFNIAVKEGLVDSVPTIDYDKIASLVPTHIEATKLSNYFKEPTIADFFELPKGNRKAELKELIAQIPFPMISYTISPEDFSITARLSYERLMGFEDAKILRQFAKPQLVYVWDGKRYKLQK